MTCPLAVGGLQQGETVVLLAFVRHQRIEGAVGALEDQLVEHIVRRRDALVSDADVGLLHTVGAVIVRRAPPGGDLHGQQFLALLLQRTQDKLRQGRDTLFDEAADCLGVLLRVGKANDAAVIIHAEQQHPADPIGKGADTFQPAFRFFHFQSDLEIDLRRLGDQFIEHGRPLKTNRRTRRKGEG